MMKMMMSDRRTGRLATLERVSSYWMPELQRLRIKVPIILVACKSDVRVANPDNLSGVRLLWSSQSDGQKTLIVMEGIVDIVCA